MYTCTGLKIKAGVLSIWTGDQSSLEGLNGLSCGHVLRKAVPQSDTLGKEEMLNTFYPAEWDKESQLVIFVGRKKGRRYLNEVVDFPVHHQCGK